MRECMGSRGLDLMNMHNFSEDFDMKRREQIITFYFLKMGEGGTV